MRELTCYELTRRMATFKKRSDATCDSCGESRWKYRCPGCDRLSCSLQCVKKHKMEHSCEGRRCKTAYTSLSEFDDAQLLSDYYFLEEVGRFSDSAHRERLYMNREHLDSQRRRQLFIRLRSAAERRGIRLLLLAPGMTLHTINTSRTIWHGHRRGCEIVWRVHLNFPLSSVEYQEESVPEATHLTSLLSKYLHPTESDPIARHRLRRYIREGGVDAAVVLMKVECVHSKHTRYHKMDKMKSISENLAGKDVVEFPVFHVILSSETSRYLLYSTDTAVGLAVDEQTLPLNNATGSDHKPTHNEDSVFSSTNSNSLQLIAQTYSNDSD